MEVKIYMKDPDAVYEAVQDAVEREVAGIADLSDEERDLLVPFRVGAVMTSLAQWLEFGECLTVVFDTDASTAMIERRG